MTVETTINVEKLNEDIAGFPQVHPITADMKMAFEGVSRLVMLDRYAFKDTEKKTLAGGDFVVLTVKDDPQFPARGYGFVAELSDDQATVALDEQFHATAGTENLTVPIAAIDKPLEIYYEQIARRNATGLASVETDSNKQAEMFVKFYEELVALNFVPAGRVLYGAGSETDVTFFNCYVMPFPRDSRGGLGEHRNEVMEIMSRGGGVGTNGSTLRPRNALARRVNGKSSGSVSWLNDLAELTHLISQGGSRRGAQMLMMADWHPDIIEFILSKMQNPDILRRIIADTQDAQIRKLAQDKLKFTPLLEVERAAIELAIECELHADSRGFSLNEGEKSAIKYSKQLLADGGTYSVHNPEFLSGANISVALTREFMQAVEDDAEYALRFPDVENYSEYDMALYDDHWHEVGDVREWEARGMAIKTYRTIKARELWHLINVCATYSAEPGVFFIDAANDATNAQAYGQKVVATNPCFTGDMRLLTESGYKSFEELSPDGEVAPVRIVNKDGVVSDGTVWSSGIKDIVEVRLGNGSRITCTPDHVFMTNTGDEVEAGELKGRRVMPDLVEPSDFDRKFELFGFIQGDGQLTRIGNESFRGLEVHVGQGDLEVRHMFRNYTDIIEYGDDRRIYVSGLNDELTELGFSSSVLPERVMPTSYDSWDETQKRSFIRGCYSANGSVINVGRVSYKTTCKEFAEQLVATLDVDFGIKAYITTNKPKEVEFENGMYLCKESYDVNIANFEGMQKFYNEIGFIHRYKMFKLREVLIEKAPKVVNVVPAGEKREVYDFNEPLTHWGVVEGVVVHNCGEQPLAPYSVCNLAAVNLANMADKENKTVDYDKLRQTVSTGVRMMDNVIDATPYFLEANRKQALGERRLGLGVMGLADLLIYCEAVYGSPEGNAIVDKVFETIATTAYRASIELAKEKGSFPFLLDDIHGEEAFINSGFMQNMPEDIRQGIRTYGIRNSHLLTVAPTGSTGSMVGRATGLEPYFAFKYYRSGRLGNFIEVNAQIVQEYLDANPDVDPANLPEWFVSTMALSPEQHVDVQCIIQRWVDSSLSKTVNAPKGYTVEQVQSVYERLYKGGAKGGTVYVDGSRDAQVLSLTNGEDEEEMKPTPTVEKKYGTDLGDNCPVCREGTVVEAGGCHTCDTCGTQLQCGL